MGLNNLLGFGKERMPFRFDVEIKNFYENQKTTYSKTIQEHTTIGLIAAQREGMKRFREEWPENTDEEKYLNIKTKIKFVKE